MRPLLRRSDRGRHRPATTARCATPVAILDAEGKPHTMVYRLSRGPAGIAARLVEQDPPPDGGYEFEEFGDHDAEPSMPLDLVTVRAAEWWGLG